MKKRNAKRNAQFLAAAALTAVLISGQTGILPVQANGDSVEVSSLIPDNVTVDEPTPLSGISLPSSDYGTLSWVDDSSVPSKRVQSYEVVFRPYNTADLAKISGWDGQSDAIYSSVTVVVSSISSDSSEESYDDSQESYDDSGYSEEEYSGDDSYDGSEEYTEEASSDYSGEDENSSDSGSTGENENSGSEAENSEAASEADGTEENGEESVTPEAAETTETEETPEATGMPETTEAADITEAPEVTGAAEAAEATGTPEAAKTPETAEDPDAEITPEVTVAPDVTEAPDVTAAPEADSAPDASLTPSVTVTPEADKDNIFDGKQKQISKDTRSDSAEEDLTEEEQEARAAENHTCNGISVSGINLPWYVQFRVTSGEDYQFSNEAEAGVFKSYEFELWDLKNNTEYQIPDGEYISVTVPVKAGYDYTIEHLLDSGAIETIVPSVDGSTMVFSTHSFSPFGIAGSKSLIDNKVEDNTYVTPTPASASSNTANTSADTTSAAVTSAAESSGTAASDTSSQTTVTETTGSETDESSQEDQSDSTDTVNTGDNTPILPFVILGIAAVVIIAVIIYLRKRKN